MDHMTPARETPLQEPAVLAQAHRTIRLLDRSEGPFHGALVTSPDGPLVRADAESFAGWAGWRYAGSQHIAAPVDIARRLDGHDVLLPWCTERLESYLDRRLRTQGGLPPGEIGTVVVSLLRGLAELGPAPAVEAQGTWWLTEGGRPLFVVGPGQEAASAVSEIVGRLRAECTDKMLARALDRARDRIGTAAAQRRVPRRLLEEVESELLEMAAPRPLEEAAEDRAGPAVETGVAGALRRVRVEPVARVRGCGTAGHGWKERADRARHGSLPTFSFCVTASSAGREPSSASRPAGRSGPHRSGGPDPDGHGFSPWRVPARWWCCLPACCGLTSEMIRRSGPRRAGPRPRRIERGATLRT
jgi:hypothetical protein